MTMSLMSPSCSLSCIDLSFLQPYGKRSLPFCRTACGINQRKLVPCSSKMHFINRKQHNPQYPRLIIVKAQRTYTSDVTVVADIPLSEVPHASFDSYMEHKPRVLKAIFPENRGTQQLNEEEWRIKMDPIGFMILTAWPIVNMRMRCNTKSKEYPSGVPTHTTKVLELKLIKWGFEDVVIKPSEFSLSMEGALYPHRQEGYVSKIKSQLHLGISFTPPPVLDLFPPHVHQEFSSKVLKNLADRMKHKVNHNLLVDYTKFKKEKSKKFLKY